MRALSLLGLGLIASVALAQAPKSIAIEAPATVRAGDRKTISVRVTLPADAAYPVLLTTSSEGSALEVVRGRFLREDAADPKATILRFDVPIVARVAGAAIFRAHVLTYRCTDRCVALEQEAEASIEIAK